MGRALWMVCQPQERGAPNGRRYPDLPHTPFVLGSAWDHEWCPAHHLSVLPTLVLRLGARPLARKPKAQSAARRSHLEVILPTDSLNPRRSPQAAAFTIDATHEIAFHTGWPFNHLASGGSIMKKFFTAIALTGAPALTFADSLSVPFSFTEWRILTLLLLAGCAIVWSGMELTRYLWTRPASMSALIGILVGGYAGTNWGGWFGFGSGIVIGAATDTDSGKTPFLGAFAGTIMGVLTGYITARTGFHSPEVMAIHWLGIAGIVFEIAVQAITRIACQRQHLRLPHP